MSSCSISKLEKMGVYKELTSIEYIVYVTDSLVNIIDVRSPKEYKKSHIEGAINISYFGGSFKEELDKQKFDTTKTMLIYCETQHRSLFVANKLYKAGFKSIVDLEKGMRVWRKNNYPFIGVIPKD